MLIANIHSTYEAIQTLKSRGLFHDKVLVPQYSKNNFNYMQGWHKIMVDGIHVHFMRDNCDIAYFTPLMKTLNILDTPRVWAIEALENAKEEVWEYKYEE